jgi:large subunit ribosomal protein L3
MSGHLGNVQRTIQNLEILRVDNERGLLVLKGAIPGSKGGDVVVRPSAKVTKVRVAPVSKGDVKPAGKSGSKSGKK